MGVIGQVESYGRAFYADGRVMGWKEIASWSGGTSSPDDNGIVSPLAVVRQVALGYGYSTPVNFDLWDEVPGILPLATVEGAEGMERMRGIGMLDEAAYKTYKEAEGGELWRPPALYYRVAASDLTTKRFAPVTPANASAVGPGELWCRDIFYYNGEQLSHKTYIVTFRT